MKAITFGDVFRYQEKPHVFLTKTEDIVYAAEILNSEISREFIHQANRPAKDNPDKYELLYCFVELSTDKFKNRVCFLGKPGIDDDGIKYDVFATLDGSDLKKIIRKIEINDNVPIYLKKWVKKMDY